MKNKNLLFPLILCILVFCACKQTTIPLETEKDKFYPIEDYFNLKSYPEKSFNWQAFQKAKEIAFEQSNSGFRTNGTWEFQGPGNIGGRANKVTADPNDAMTFYAGFSQGGIFKTTDFGENWDPIFDDQTNLAIGDIVVTPNNSDIVYVGTGDPNISGYPFIGNGVYKSTDAGSSWEHLGLSEQSIISKIALANSNDDIIYAATMGIPFERSDKRGLYKSTDGGTNWEQVLFISDSTGVIDVVIHPSNDEIVFATGWDRIRNNQESLISGVGAKIYRSLNGGMSWDTLTTDLPVGPMTRVDLELDPSNPNMLTAFYVNAYDDDCETLFDVEGIFRSFDNGESWTEIPTSEDNGLDCNILGGFGWYFGKFAVNPTNPDDIYILGVDLWQTLDGGQNWFLATPPWWTYEVHADKHDLIFTEDGLIVLATDGGLYYSFDGAGGEWTDFENIPTTQFYRVAINPFEPDVYYGGAQDNGSTGGNKNGINDWDRIFGGDGFQMAFHPNNPDIFFVETQRGSIRYTIDGGQSFENGNMGLGPGEFRNWDMPYMISHHDPEVMYAGTNRLCRNSTGVNVFWEPISEDLTKGTEVANGNPTITTLHESSLDPNFLAVGTVDGNVWKTEDGGNDWTKITTGLPNRYVSDIKISHFWGDWMYVTLTGYKDNDQSPHIYRSKDRGETWENIAGNLPPLAINDVYVIDNNFDNHLFVGTDGGIYWSGNAGETWERLGENMPIVPVYDLEYNEDNNEIVAGTFARGIASFDLGQIDVNTNPSQVDDLIKAEENYLLAYPTISDGQFTIKNTSNQDIKTQILSLDGRLIKSVNCHPGTTELNLELDAGRYFITGGNSSTSILIR